MAKFKGRESHIHLIARGLLMREGEVVLCRAKGSKWFFLPGGHVEDGESARTALLRELKEEIGGGGYRITSFIGACENIFSLEEDVFQHEMNIIFKVYVPGEVNISSKEDHLEFITVAKNELKDYKILPTTLKDNLIEWIENEELFFVEI